MPRIRALLRRRREHGDARATDRPIFSQSAVQRQPFEAGHLLHQLQRGTVASTAKGVLQRRIPGWGGFPLIGTPTSIVDELLTLCQVGISGCLLSWVDYEREQRQWIEEVLPLLERAGLRESFVPSSAGEENAQ
jgi:alkanesulfonate monooxygenase SsuD/methylene tetrahydromethanopterin reductase-like flavin-dependent oxidoreductase (luciferase family)